MLEEETTERKWTWRERKNKNGCGNSAVWLLVAVSLGFIDVPAPPWMDYTGQDVDNSFLKSYFCHSQLKCPGYPTMRM